MTGFVRYSVVACFLLMLPEGIISARLSQDVVEPHRYRRGGEVKLDTSIFLKDAPYFDLPIKNVTAQVGHPAKLTCVVESLGQYKVAWGYKGTGAVLTVGTSVITNNARVSVQREMRSTWVLTINSLTRRDQGGYWCQVNTTPPRSIIGYINVVEPPVLEGRDEEVTVNSGDSTNLTCRARGTPTPNIRWRREDNRPIRINPHLMVEEVDGNHLTLLHVNQSSAGGYLCIASNGHPPSVSRRIKVRVNFAPVVRGPRTTLWVPQGATVSLTCLYAAHPEPHVAWRRINALGSQLLGHDYFTVTPQDGHPPFTHNMTLKIRNLVMTDFGHYTCTVKNRMGEDVATTFLRELLTTTTITTTTTTTTVSPLATTALLPPPRLLYRDYDDDAKNLTAPLVFNTFPDVAKGVRQEGSGPPASSTAAAATTRTTLPIRTLHSLILLLPPLLLPPLLPTPRSHRSFFILVFAVAWLTL